MPRHQPDDFDPWGHLWSEPWPWLEEQLAKEAYVDPEPFRWGRTNQALADKTDAAKECPHGKLPGDRVQTCSCFDVEQEAPGSGASAEVAPVSEAPPSGPPAERPEAA